MKAGIRIKIRVQIIEMRVSIGYRLVGMKNWIEDSIALEFGLAQVSRGMYSASGLGRIRGRLIHS